MTKTILLTLLLTLPTLLHAKQLTLLSLPLGNGETFDYTIDQVKECSFEGVTEIKVSDFEDAKKTNFLVDKLSFFQKKLNLNIDKKEISPENISFSLTGSTNVFFEFFYRPPEISLTKLYSDVDFKESKCVLMKVMHIDDKTYNLDHIEVVYSNTLKNAVVQKITIKDDENPNGSIDIYPWQLRGQMAVYELNVGPAVNIHTNIRLNDLDKYQKNNPVVEPIPAFFFRYGPIFLNKNGLGSLLFHKGDLSILGMGLLEGEPYRAQGLYARDKGIFAGGIVKFNALEFTYYNDFLKNKGYNLKLNLAPEFYYRMSWKFSPQIFLQYWNNSYVDYYFGVKPEEASSQWRQFEGKATMNYGAMFETQHFVKKWTFVVSTGVKVYGKEVYSSPTVTRQKEMRFIASILYKIF